MQNLIKKLDDRLLRNNPFLWIVGAHYLPVLLISAAVLFAIGFAYNLDVEEAANGAFNTFFFTVNLLVVLFSILLLILFIIRQIRFNQMRIHSSLPYKNGILYFLTYFLIIGAISALPYMSNLGAFSKAYIQTKELRQKLLFEQDRNSDFPQFFEYRSPSVTEGVEIEATYEEMRFATMVHHRSDMFVSASWSFWKYYLLVALGFAVMLFAVCASQLKDFGWAMLISALFPIVLGITVALVNLIFSPDSAQSFVNSYTVIMSLMLIIAGVMAFVPGAVKPGTSRSYAIMLFLFVPYFVYSYFMAYDPEEMIRYLVPIVYGSTLIAVFFFNSHFKRRYLNPI